MESQIVKMACDITCKFKEIRSSRSNNDRNFKVVMRVKGTSRSASSIK